MCELMMKSVNELSDMELSHVCSFLDATELTSVALVNNRFNRISEKAASLCLNLASRKTISHEYGSSVRELEGNNKFKLNELCRQRLLAFGGSFDPSGVRDLDLDSGKWDEHDTDAIEREQSALTVLKGEAYLLSGVSDCGSVSRYSPATKVWTNLSPIPEQLVEVSATSDGADSIFVSGGRHSTSGRESRSLQVYVVSEDRWKVESELPVSCRGHASVYFEDEVIIAGGLSLGEPSCAVRAYDPSSGSWRELPSLCHTRHHFSLVVVKNQLYAVGGDEGGTIEVFDGSAWVVLTKFQRFIRNFSVCVVNDSIFIIGGRTRRSAFLSTCSSYNTATGEWSKAGKVPGGGYVFGAAAVVPSAPLSY